MDKNRDATKWGKEIVKALEEVGDGESTDKLFLDEERGALREILGSGIKVMINQEIKGNWNRIDRSNITEITEGGKMG